MHVYQKFTCKRLLLKRLPCQLGAYQFSNDIYLLPSKSIYQPIIQPHHFLGVVSSLVVFCLVAFGLVSPHLRGCP